MTPELVPPHPTLSGYPANEERSGFVRSLFDDSAANYDAVCALMALGSGQSYRRDALARAGFRCGLDYLDVGTGTGLIACEAARLAGGTAGIIGLDPSAGMLAELRRKLPLAVVRGVGERLPFADDRFELVSMGYALRHVGDLGAAFREYLRVLRTGGRVLILEISRPRSRVARWLLEVYLGRVVPLFVRILTGRPRTELLMRYYWDTISHCVSPEVVLTTMRESGFARVEHRVSFGVLSEYSGVKP